MNAVHALHKTTKEKVLQTSDLLIESIPTQSYLITIPSCILFSYTT